MELVLSNGFTELRANEMVSVDGGINWDMVGGTLATGAGAALGAKIGAGIGTAACPGLGSAVGGIIGGVAGAIIYTLWD